MDEITILVFFLPVLFFSVICHEVAHGYAAYWGGDDTARLSNRLTFNPIPHIDPIGTIVLPGLLILLHAPFLFGWAKPVPINPRNLKSSRWNLVVSLAGVTVNLGLAIIGALLLKIVLLAGGGMQITPDGGLSTLGVVLVMLEGMIILNLVLMLFNLIPIPPLDGSHVFLYFIRTRQSPAFQVFQFLERYGFMILIILLMFGFLQRVLVPVLSGLIYALCFVFRINPSVFGLFLG